tara:strand:- start:3433 stop:3696 length:264 start_codon:yes stop_codon:yes gene_type:complete
MSILYKELPKDKMGNALNRQIGGSHYKTYAIQPIEFITKNNIPFIEANVIKYLCRWKDKGGIEDLDKCIHYIELLKDIELGNEVDHY